MAKEEQIKTSIDLTGEKEYRAACTNINSSLREIGSEMKLTTAEFADSVFKQPNTFPRLVFARVLQFRLLPLR